MATPSEFDNLNLKVSGKYQNLSFDVTHYCKHYPSEMSLCTSWAAEIEMDRRVRPVAFKICEISSNFRGVVDPARNATPTLPFSVPVIYPLGTPELH
jgi:hypothetical protein